MNVTTSLPRHKSDLNYESRIYGVMEGVPTNNNEMCRTLPKPFVF